MNEILHDFILIGELKRRKQMKSDDRLKVWFKRGGNYWDGGLVMGVLVLSYCVE